MGWIVGIERKTGWTSHVVPFYLRVQWDGMDSWNWCGTSYAVPLPLSIQWDGMDGQVGHSMQSHYYLRLQWDGLDSWD